MVEVLILVLFLISGGATGWMGVHLLPQEMLDDVTDVQRVRLGLTVIGTGVGAVAGLVFKRLRLQLMQQVRTMPTDLLISRSVGLILGLLVANLLLAPILLLPLSGGVTLVKPLAAVLSNVFFGVLGYNLPRFTAAPFYGCSTQPAQRLYWWQTGSSLLPHPRFLIRV
jgi:uncharacterized protein YacL